MKQPPAIQVFLLGEMRVVCQVGGAMQDCPLQPRPLCLLAYLALNWGQASRREALQALLWPDKGPGPAANNLRQALWHLRRALPADTLTTQGDEVGWNPADPAWVDVLAFEAALEAGDLDLALALYQGPFLPDSYDEWAQLERERLHLRYLAALECRAQGRYQGRQWQAAQADAETLQAADPLNETAVRLLMACHWAQGQREAARRCYDAYRQRVNQELRTDPLPETTDLYRRILRGEAHPDLAQPSAEEADQAMVARSAHLSLLETLGAFRQGLEQASAWLAELDQQAPATALSEAGRWQGRFYLRLGQLQQARAALTAALSQTLSPIRQVALLADLATSETGLGDYRAAAAHYAQALHLAPPEPAVRWRLLSSQGGLLGRIGRLAEARQALQAAVQLARVGSDPAALAIASGNLGILLIGCGEQAAAEAALQESLEAASHADAHWLTAHATGHLGVLAQDRGELAAAADHYQAARTLAGTIGDQRGATLWTLNLGVIHYEQGRPAEAQPLLAEGRAQAAVQGSRSLEAGATIFMGACLVAQGEGDLGLATIDEGLALAQSIGDQERVLIGLLHRGRALTRLGKLAQARATLQTGLTRAETSQMQRLAAFLRDELDQLSAC